MKIKNSSLPPATNHSAHLLIIFSIMARMTNAQHMLEKYIKGEIASIANRFPINRSEND